MTETLSKLTYEDVANLIAEAAKREDLTTEDILNLTIAHRLSKCSDHSLAQALGGGNPPVKVPWHFLGIR